MSCPAPIATATCSAAHASDLNAPRRRVIRIAALGFIAPLALTGRSAVAATAGDRLVDEDAEGAPLPLTVADLKPGKPMLAYPFDPRSGKRRDESRLNKVVLIRLPEAEMTAETRARAAGGVLAYSAICTHQGCDAKTWLSKERALVCFCHASKFALLDGAAVVSGPAPRALPALALALDGEQLVIVAAFSATPGGSPA
jgi:rieske iron-sulfur protein